MSRIITTKDLIRTVAKRWKDSYYRNGKWDDHVSYTKSDRYEKLAALDPETATEFDVDEIIGNRGWASLTCNECGEYTERVRVCGQEPEYDSATAYMCQACLETALNEFGDNEAVARRTIYVDMDGVLADFDGGFFDRYGQWPQVYEKTHGKKAFWDTVYSTDDFFETLPPMRGAVEAYRTLCETERVKILSAPSSTKRNSCIHQKMTWIAKHLGQAVHDAIFEKDKYKYAKPGDILIDDRADKLNAWKNAGGTAIFFTTWEDVLMKLKRSGEVT